MAFPSYETVRDASDAQVEQTTYHNHRKHVAWAYQFWVEENSADPAEHELCRRLSQGPEELRWLLNQFSCKSDQ